jgi:5-methylcytosine-specific restriction protein B
LAGPPGTGKLAGARRFAEQWLGQDETDIAPDSRIQEAKFSPDMSPAAVIDGTEWQDDTELLTGPLGHLCDLAIAGPDDAKYVLILEDFHRGDCRDIFGEAWPLLSRSRRGRKHSIQLSRSRVEFWIPDNVYLIGVMNTGEQSLEGLPTAVRRRFRPVATEPLYQRLFEAYSDIDDDVTDQPKALEQRSQESIRALYSLNQALVAAPDCGEGVRLGHMYLSASDATIQPYESVGLLADVWQYDIFPQFRSFVGDLESTNAFDDADLAADIRKISRAGSTADGDTTVWDVVEALAAEAPDDLLE